MSDFRSMTARLVAPHDQFVIAEVISAAEQRFSRLGNGEMLQRYALEVAIDLLSSGPRVVDYIPELALTYAADRAAA